MVNKYRNRFVWVDNIRFDSKKEAEHFVRLRNLLKMGKIKKLILKPVYVLQPKFVDYSGKSQRAIKYIPDFRYVEPTDDKTHIIDVKGFLTEGYKIKKKMFLKIMSETMPDHVFEEIY